MYWWLLVPLIIYLVVVIVTWITVICISLIYPIDTDAKLYVATRIAIYWPYYIWHWIKETKMRPFSWLSNWLLVMIGHFGELASKLGIPVWIVYVGIGVVSVLLINFFFG